jgi:hypothetical protein
VGELEWGGWAPSAAKVQAEIEAGLRNPDGSAKPAPA